MRGNLDAPQFPKWPLGEVAKDLIDLLGDLADPLFGPTPEPEGWWGADRYVGYTRQEPVCAENPAVCTGALGCTVNNYTRINADVTHCGPGCNGTFSSTSCFPSFEAAFADVPNATRYVKWHRKSITTGHAEMWWKKNPTTLAGNGKKQIIAALSLVDEPVSWPDTSDPISSPSSSGFPTPADTPAWVPKKYVPGYADPVPEVVLRPGRDTAPLPRPEDPPNGTHYKLPDLSKKIQMPAWLFALINGYHGATEVNDFFESLADAIPGGVCSNMPGFQRALCVLEHFDEIDWNTAIENLILNQIEDKVVGSVIGALGKAGQGGGYVWGPTTTRSTGYIRNLMGNL